MSGLTPLFGVVFLAFPVFLARLAGEESSAVPGEMKTRETFTGDSRHPKTIICVVIWDVFSYTQLNGAIHLGAQSPLQGKDPWFWVGRQR